MSSSSSAFDALDFFHAQQSQQKYQLARLDDAKNCLDQSRTRLELVEADFAHKKRQHGEVVRRKQSLFSHSLLADQVTLLSNRAELICSVETKTLDRTGAMDREITRLVATHEDDESGMCAETAQLLAASEVLVRSALRDQAKYDVERATFDVDLVAMRGRNALLEEECQAAQRRLQESNARGREVRAQVQDTQASLCDAQKELDLVVEQKQRLSRELFEQNQQQHQARQRELDEEQAQLDLLVQRQRQLEVMVLAPDQQPRELAELEREVEVAAGAELDAARAELAQGRTLQQQERYDALLLVAQQKRASVAQARLDVRTAAQLWEEDGRRQARHTAFNSLVVEHVEPLKIQVFDLKLKVKQLAEGSAAATASTV